MTASLRWQPWLAGALMYIGASPATTVVARSLHYGAISDPALAACEALEWTGQRDPARGCYRDLMQTSTNPALQAEALWALDDVKGANSRFQAAVRTNPDSADVRQRWGELYLQTYQYQDALELFQEALERNPDQAYAKVGVARALAERFEAEAQTTLQQVLDNPDTPAGARLQALLLLARMAMEAEELPRAVTILDEATTLAEAAGLPVLEIYALRAAMDLIHGDGSSVWIDRALAIHPGYGDVYAIPGYFYWIGRRYREAVEVFEQAVAIEPDHWIAHMELGINLLRDNRVSESRRHLEIAYAGDPYNAKTVNSLRLLDTFDEYDLINSPRTPPPDGFPRVTFRLHRDESAVLLPYAEQLTLKGIEEYSRRYRFEPKEPVIVEIYPNHDDFVVRTIGMPGVGILGAAFGYVFAMDSPSDHADGDYHWGTTLWHELAHVFTLETTQHLIPRWFSEGLSVYEEWRHGPIPGIRLPINVLDAMAAEKFLPIANLDNGFMRPTYDDQVIVSYMQAGLVCIYLERRYGFDAVLGMLEQFRAGATTADAVRKVLGVEPIDFDREFIDFIDAEYGELLGLLDSWKTLHQLAMQKLGEGDTDGAAIAARRAIEIFPAYVESDSPYLLLAGAQEQGGDERGRIETLMRYYEQGGYAPGALWALARHHEQTGNREQAIRILQGLNYVRPFDPDLHTTLGDWLLEADQPEQALLEYEVALAMKPHDMATAWYRLARAQHRLARMDEARRSLLSALEIAPHFRPAQKLLLETTQTRQQ